MKALILNSGSGIRMGEITKVHPKCMTEIYGQETIISRQLKILETFGIRDVVITTGAFSDQLEEYCRSLKLPLNISFVHNSKYLDTNYIYSIFLASGLTEGEDILLLHGDLVFEHAILSGMLEAECSCMAVCSNSKLPQKDFKAVVADDKIQKIGVEFFEHAVAAQPIYKLNSADWKIWLNKIHEFCKAGNVKCYAENAFNRISSYMSLHPYDVGSLLCQEIDTKDDWKSVSEKVKELENRTVYMCFSTDILHSGHMAILKKAACIGKLTVGVLSDNAVASYKRFPLIPYEERKELLKNT